MSSKQRGEGKEEEGIGGARREEKKVKRKRR